MADKIQFLISGFTIGIIFFQTALSAPIVFSHLKKDQASIYIRRIFPKIFSLITIMGLIFLSIHFLFEVEKHTSIANGAITTLLPFICYLLVPATNKATDLGNSKTFKYLHTLSVLMICVVFLSNLLWVFI